MTGLDWAAHAACQGADPAQFFPDEDGGTSAGGRPKAASAARRYCAHCPVLAECRSAGDQMQGVGVWGGVVRWHRGARIARQELLGRAAS